MKRKQYTHEIWANEWLPCRAWVYEAWVNRKRRVCGKAAETLQGKATSILCPVCGERVTLHDMTSDGRLIATCGDSFKNGLL